MGLFSSLASRAIGNASNKVIDTFANNSKRITNTAKDLYQAKKNILPDTVALSQRAIGDIKSGKGLSSIGRGEGLTPSQNTTVGGIKGAASTVIGVGKYGDKILGAVTKPLVGTSVSQTPQGQAMIKSAQESTKPVGVAQSVGYGAEKIGEAVLINPVKVIGAGQKVVGAVPVIGKVLGKNAPKIVQTVIQASADGLAGAGQSVISDIAKGEEDWNKIKANAKKSALWSAALPIAIGSGAGFLKGASHQVGQGEGFLKGVKNIGEETLAGGGFVNMPQRAINREGNLGYQFSKKLAKAEESDNEVVSGAAKGLRDLTSKWLDDRAPILRDFVGKIKESGGNSDDAAEALNAVQRTKNVDSRVLGKAYQQHTTFANIAGGDDIAKLVDDTDAYADMLTKLETTRTSKEGIESLKNVQGKLDDFLASRSPEEIAKIKQAHEATVRAYNQAELAEDVAAGLISREGADAAIAKYPNYSKQVILEYLDDSASKAANNKQLKRTLGDIGWTPRLEEARGDLDAMSATQANLLGTMIRDKKRAMNTEVLTMVNLDAKHGAGVFQKLGTEADKIDKVDAVSAIPVFRNGVKEYYKVNDRAVLDYFKGMEKKDDGFVMSALKLAGDWTRKTATQYNPVFGFKNAIIDYQTANSNLPAGMTLALDEWTDGLKKSKQLVGGLKPGEEVDSTIQYMLDNGIPLTSFGKELSKKNSGALADIIKGKKASSNPLDIIMDGVSQSELATRYAVVKAAKRAGVTDPNEIRELARNATIDFSVSGQSMREVNKVVPFLNARTQALRNTLKAFAKDPAGFTRKQQFMSIYPQMMVDQWNKQFDLSTIPPYERDNNIIFVLGYKTDEDGNRDVKRFSIPRSDGQKIFPKIMDVMSDNTKTAQEKTIEMIKSFSQFSPVDGMPQLGGSFGNALTGLRTNKDWRGYDIVPQSTINGPNRAQVSKSTSPTIRGLTETVAKLTGQTEYEDGKIDLSPKKTEFLVKTLGGGVGTEILKGIDAVANYKKTGKINMSKLPGASVLYREDAMSVDPKISEQNKELEKSDKLRKFNLSEKSKDITKQILDTPIEKRGDLIDELEKSGELTPEVQEKIKADMKKKGYAGGVNPSASNLIKAKEIITYLDAAKTTADKSARFDELEKANLISDGAKDYMVAWKFVEQMKAAKTQEEKEAVFNKLEPLLSEEVKKAAVEIKQMEPYLK